MGLVPGQSATYGRNEEGVVGRNAQPLRFAQLAIELEVKGRCQGAQEVIGR